MTASQLSCSRSSKAASFRERAQLSTTYPGRVYRPDLRGPDHLRGPRSTPTAPPRRGSPARRRRPTAKSTIRWVRGTGSVAGAGSPNSIACTRARVGDDELPGRQRHVRRGAAEALAAHGGRVRPGSRHRPGRHPGPTPARRSRPARSAARPRARRAIGSRRASRRRTAASSLGIRCGVGVEPDLAEEDAVGVRHRLGAQRHHAWPRETGRTARCRRRRSSRGLAPRRGPRAAVQCSRSPGNSALSSGVDESAGGAQLEPSPAASSARTRAGQRALADPVLADQPLSHRPAARRSSSSSGQAVTP